jgi:hypothetical protein
MYPIRCKLVEGDPHDGPPRPEDNNPHVGEMGVAEERDGQVVIVLDSGVEVADSDCWWVEVKSASEI